MRTPHGLLCLVPLLLVGELLAAQTAPATVPGGGEPSIFAPLTLPPAPSATRLASGAPGPKYWQNRADYDLKATLDTTTHTLRGSMTLRYTNNSPDTLKVFWFQTEQRSEVIDRFEQVVGAKSVPVVHEHPDTDVFETRVPLAEPLTPGKTTTFRVDWHFTVPYDYPLRMGRSAKYPTYELGQWYPRVNVYDDVKGWNTESYATNAEFYLEYGDYTLEVTVPAGFIVAATGTLDNPTNVLTATEMARVAQAAKADSVVHIITVDEIKSGAARPAKPTQDGMLTWKFHAKNVRDAAWATAPDYQWDATHWHDILVQAYYRPLAAENWVDAADQARMSIQEYSERWYPYPYPQISVVEGPVSGMEYPMLAMQTKSKDKPDLYLVLTHEVGHNWFPMIVGSNERMHAWMDEGFNTFINAFSAAHRYPKIGDPVSFIANNDNLLSAGGILETGKPTGNGDFAQYAKTAHMLVYLRRDVLGPAVFDSAFRTYIRRWAYKHPTPMDFFRTMEDVSGRKLDWFWRECFLEAPALDQAIDSVAQTVQGAETRVTVTYRNKARDVFPLFVRFTFSDSTTQDVTYPADVWRANPSAYTVSYTFHNKMARRVVLDPDRRLLDDNRSNNAWTAK